MIIWFLCHFYFHNCLIFVQYVLTCLSNRFLRLIVVGVLYKVLLELWLKSLVCMKSLSQIKRNSVELIQGGRYQKKILMLKLVNIN